MAVSKLKTLKGINRKTIDNGIEVKTSARGASVRVGKRILMSLNGCFLCVVRSVVNKDENGNYFNSQRWVVETPTGATRAYPKANVSYENANEAATEFNAWFNRQSPYSKAMMKSNLYKENRSDAIIEGMFFNLYGVTNVTKTTKTGAASSKRKTTAPKARVIRNAR